MPDNQAYGLSVAGEHQIVEHGVKAVVVSRETKNDRAPATPFSEGALPKEQCVAEGEDVRRGHMSVVD